MPDRVAPATAVLTLDVDWAPEFMVDFCAKLIASAGVRATWFATNPSAAIERLRARPDLFEIGIHPNFLPGSTHGSTSAEVLAYCNRLAPNARSLRTHGLAQTSNLLEEIIERTRVSSDFSVFLPHARHVEPVTYYWPGGAKLLRVPYVWEDDFEMVRPRPLWDCAPLIEGCSGPRIFDFHPVHVFLNSANLDPYRRLKSLGPLTAVDWATASTCVAPGRGTRAMFESLLEHLQRHGSMAAGDIEAPEKREGC